MRRGAARQVVVLVATAGMVGFRGLTTNNSTAMAGLEIVAPVVVVAVVEEGRRGGAILVAEGRTAVDGPNGSVLWRASTGRTGNAVSRKR